MIRTLQMVFRNVAGRNVTVSVPDARADLQAVEVEAIMAGIIGRDVFRSPGGALTEALRAQVISRQVETLVEY